MKLYNVQYTTPTQCLEYCIPQCNVFSLITHSMKNELELQLQFYHLSLTHLFAFLKDLIKLKRDNINGKLFMHMYTICESDKTYYNLKPDWILMYKTQILEM